MSEATPNRRRTLVDVIVNVAVGGDGVVKGGGAPAGDITETMTIHGVKRHIISP